MTITLTGEVERITYENEVTGFRVLKLGNLEGAHGGRRIVVATGVVQPIGAGARVRVTGNWVNDARHGEQLRVQSMVVLEPETLSGLEKYLGSGVIQGIGPGFAKRIVAAFGMDTLKVLDQEPQRLKEVAGLGAQRIQDVIRGWSEQRALSNLMLVLQQHGISPALAARIHQRYGERAAEIVQRSPYRLAIEVRGIGFKTADAVARSLGISGDHPERAQAGTLHELGSLTDQGHCAVPREELIQRVAQALEIDPAHVAEAINALWASERVVVEPTPVALSEGVSPTESLKGGELVYPARLHAAEERAARGILRLMQAPAKVPEDLTPRLARFEKSSGIQLAPGQRAAVLSALENKVVVITGGPGVGKTTIVRAILALSLESKLTVKLAAPTGRAAKRLGEATGQQAMTLHRLLEFEPRTFRFQHHAENPLSVDMVIIDEVSMVDLQLTAALLDALPPSARLVLVGDADQLPSVGPGAVLRDIIRSKVVPTVRLTEIFRQAEQSGIVQNAHRILRGETPVSDQGEAENADFFVIQRRDQQKAADLIQTLVTERIPQRFGFDPIKDIQVLTPMHRGAAGTLALNDALQAALNPEGPALVVGGQRLRAGDKVMQMRNDYEREVFNGDVGSVERVDVAQRTLSVRFDGREVVYDGNDADALTLAYAASIHKSQGSEYPVVVLPLLTAHFVMLSRNLLYTAVTRAKKLCVLIADERALRLALQQVHGDERITLLDQRLRRLLV